MSSQCPTCGQIGSHLLGCSEPTYRWLVENFTPEGQSTGLYMACQVNMTLTADVNAARKFRTRRTAEFRAADMREARRGDWRAVEHGFLDNVQACAPWAPSSAPTGSAMSSTLPPLPVPGMSEADPYWQDVTTPPPTLRWWDADQMRAYGEACAAAAVAAEREAIAKWYDEYGYLLDESDVAAAIRARGET